MPKQNKSKKTRENWKLSSMTGFGRAKKEHEGFALCCEVRALNHRGLDIKINLPPMLYEHEAHYGDLVRERLHRGRVDVTITVALGREQSRLQFDVANAQRLLKNMLISVQEIPAVEPSVRLGDLLKCRDLFFAKEEPLLGDTGLTHVEQVIREALAQVCHSRQKEGGLLRQALGRIWENCWDQCEEIAQLASQDHKLRFAGLKARLASLTDSAAMDPERIYQEAALLAERSDITEEADRLRAHLIHFESVCVGTQDKGRRLDFLCQEMLRETNTLLSKAFDKKLSALAIELKSEIERLREQIQNIE